MGYLPDAMMNYLANLGWNDGTNKEIYSPQELVQAFDLTRIIKSAAIFDMDKLKWINGQHIRGSSIETLAPLVAEVLWTAETPILRAEESPAVTNFVTLATKISQKDMDLTVDARRLVGSCLGYALADSLANDPHVGEVLNDGFKEVATVVLRDYKAGKLPTGAEDTLAELWKAYMKDIGKELNKKGKGLFHPVRLALTGRMNGPDIGEQLKLIHAAKDAVPETYPLVSLDARMKELEQYLASI